MEHNQNPYQTPGADIGTTRNRHRGVTSDMADTLGRGAFWARLLSVVNFILLAFAVLGFIFNLFMGGGVVGLISNLINAAISIVIYWFYGISMHRYAGAAKSLRSMPDEDDVAVCFASFTTYLKVTGVLIIIGLVIGVIGFGAALVLPMMR